VPELPPILEVYWPETPSEPVVFEINGSGGHTEGSAPPPSPPPPPPPWLAWTSWIVVGPGSIRKRVERKRIKVGMKFRKKEDFAIVNSNQILGCNILLWKTNLSKTSNRLRFT